MRAKRTVSGILMRWLGRVLLGALLVVVLVYLGDFAVFTLRGKPMDQVILNQYMAAPLKGNKTELYYEGTGPVACAKALFAQAGAEPCWKLRKKTSVAEQP